MNNKNLLRAVILIIIFTWIGQFLIALSKLRRPFFVVKVSGVNMEPTFRIGDRLIATRYIENLHEGDIVIFLYSKKGFGLGVSRIVAIGPKRFKLRDGKEIEISGDKVFLIGDNEKASWDSWHFGPLDSKKIYGKVIKIISKRNEIN